MFFEGFKRYENKDLVGAIELWRDATRLAPGRSDYHRYLGLALAKNPRWHKEAERHLLEAAKKETRNAELLFALAALYEDVGLKRRAETQYRAILVFDPAHEKAR